MSTNHLKTLLLVFLLLLVATFLGFAIWDTVRNEKKLSSAIGTESNTANSTGKQTYEDVRFKGTKVGEQRTLQTWTNDTTLVTWYEQDYVPDSDEDIITLSSLKISKPMSPEHIVLGYDSGKSESVNVKNIVFSPKGTYITVYTEQYDSSATHTFITNTGEEIITSSYRKIPYWNEDETKLAIVQQPASIDGQPAEIYISHTGLVQDAYLVLKLPAFDWDMREVSREGDIVTVPLVYLSNEGSEEFTATYTIDLSRETLDSY